MINNIISKELLSEVLGYEVAGYTKNIFVENSLDILPLHGKINIYELAHKCKEWALTQRLPFGTTGRLQGSCYIKSTNRGSYCDAEIWTTALMAHDKYQYAEDFCEDTEPEATFKACQWILDNKETK